MATLTRTRPPAHHLLIWALLMSLAFAYVSAVSVRPDLVASVLPPVKLASLLADDDDVDLRRAAAEVEGLRRTVYSTRAEVGGLRSELARRTDREAALTQQIAAIEAREAMRVAEADAQAQAQAQTQAVAAATTKKAAVTKLVEKIRPAPQGAIASATVAPRAPNSPIAGAETAMAAVERLAAANSAQRSASSVPVVPVETASLSAKADVGAVGIMLGTGPSVDSLRLNWSVLSQRHQDDLQRLQARFAPNKSVGGQGTAYDLVAGPLPNAAEAQKVCAILRAKNVSCKVAPFTGSNL